MASLLDEVLGQAGGDTAPLLQLPDERPPFLQPDPRADALGQTFQAIVDYEKRKHQEGVDAGNWEGGWPWEGGHPTWKAAREGVDAYAQGMQAGTLKGPGPFTTYQGSPHLFEPTPKNPLGEFSNTKIGSGTGGQSEGMGHYTAENEAVAQHYRKLLAGPRADYAGEISPEFSAVLKAEDYLGFDTPGQAINAMRTHPDWATRWDPVNPGALKAGLEAHDAVKYAGQGHMYEVKINADPDRYLNWDKPLSQQHPDIQAFVGKLAGGSPRLAKHMDEVRRGIYPEPTGKELYNAVQWEARAAGAEEAKTAAAEMLREAGIPGVRYLDASSRTKGEGTHNYVTFDPAKMEIIRRYGLAGLMLGGGGLLSPNKQEQ
jgi:hypothetical protein